MLHLAAGQRQPPPTLAPSAPAASASGPPPPLPPVEIVRLPSNANGHPHQFGLDARRASKGFAEQQPEVSVTIRPKTTKPLGAPGVRLSGSGSVLIDQRALGIGAGGGGAGAGAGAGKRRSSAQLAAAAAGGAVNGQRPAAVRGMARLSDVNAVYNYGGIGQSKIVKLTGGMMGGGINIGASTSKAAAGGVIRAAPSASTSKAVPAASVSASSMGGINVGASTSKATAAGGVIRTAPPASTSKAAVASAASTGGFVKLGDGTSKAVTLTTFSTGGPINVGASTSKAAAVTYSFARPPVSNGSGGWVNVGANSRAAGFSFGSASTVKTASPKGPQISVAAVKMGMSAGGGGFNVGASKSKGAAAASPSSLLLGGVNVGASTSKGMAAMASSSSLLRDAVNVGASTSKRPASVSLDYLYAGSGTSKAASAGTFSLQLDGVNVGAASTSKKPAEEAQEGDAAKAVCASLQKPAAISISNVGASCSNRVHLRVHQGPAAASSAASSVLHSGANVGASTSASSSAVGQPQAPQAILSTADQTALAASAGQQLAKAPPQNPKIITHLPKKRKLLSDRMQQRQLLRQQLKEQLRALTPSKAQRKLRKSGQVTMAKVVAGYQVPDEVFFDLMYLQATFRTFVRVHQRLYSSFMLRTEPIGKDEPARLEYLEDEMLKIGQDLQLVLARLRIDVVRYVNVSQCSQPAAAIKNICDSVSAKLDDDYHAYAHLNSTPRIRKRLNEYQLVRGFNLGAHIDFISAPETLGETDPLTLPGSLPATCPPPMRPDHLSPAATLRLIRTVCAQHQLLTRHRQQEILAEYQAKHGELGSSVQRLPERIITLLDPVKLIEVRERQAALQRELEARRPAASEGGQEVGQAMVRVKAEEATAEVPREVKLEKKQQQQSLLRPAAERGGQEQRVSTKAMEELMAAMAKRHMVGPSAGSSSSGAGSSGAAVRELVSSPEMAAEVAAVEPHKPLASALVMRQPRMNLLNALNRAKTKVKVEPVDPPKPVASPKPVVAPKPAPIPVPSPAQSAAIPTPPTRVNKRKSALVTRAIECDPEPERPAKSAAAVNPKPAAQKSAAQKSSNQKPKPKPKPQKPKSAKSSRSASRVPSVELEAAAAAAEAEEEHVNIDHSENGDSEDEDEPKATAYSDSDAEEEPPVDNDTDYKPPNAAVSGGAKRGRGRPSKAAAAAKKSPPGSVAGKSKPKSARNSKSKSPSPSGSAEPGAAGQPDAGATPDSAETIRRIGTRATASLQLLADLPPEPRELCKDELDREAFYARLAIIGPAERLAVIERRRAERLRLDVGNRREDYDCPKEMEQFDNFDRQNVKNGKDRTGQLLSPPRTRGRRPLPATVAAKEAARLEAIRLEAEKAAEDQAQRPFVSASVAGVGASGWAVREPKDQQVVDEEEAKERETEKADEATPVAKTPAPASAAVVQKVVTVATKIVIPSTSKATTAAESTKRQAAKRRSAEVAPTVAKGKAAKVARRSTQVETEMEEQRMCLACSMTTTEQAHQCSQCDGFYHMSCHNPTHPPAERAGFCPDCFRRRRRPRSESAGAAAQQQMGGGGGAGGSSQRRK